MYSKLNFKLPPNPQSHLTKLGFLELTRLKIYTYVVICIHRPSETTHARVGMGSWIACIRESWYPNCYDASREMANMLFPGMIISHMWHCPAHNIGAVTRIF